MQSNYCSNSPNLNANNIFKFCRKLKLELFKRFSHLNAKNACLHLKVSFYKIHMNHTYEAW